MSARQGVLVYEFISAGGLGATTDAVLLAQGVAMRDALLADLARLPGCAPATVADSRAPLPAALRSVPALAPRHGEPALDFLARAARSHDRVWVIAPECDGLLLASHGAVGAARWVGCDAGAIAVASSKEATLARLAAHGVAVPARWQPGDAAFAGGTWVVKPDDGAGTTDTVRHGSFAAAHHDWRSRTGGATLQSWVEGEPLSLSLLCGSGRTELLAINRQDVTVAADGTVRYGGVEGGAMPLAGVPGRRLAALARRIGAALPGLAGYVGVDLVWSPCHGPVVIEVNPRLTCAYVGLSARLGRNLAGEILAARSEEVEAHAVA